MVCLEKEGRVGAGGGHPDRPPVRPSRRQHNGGCSHALASTPKGQVPQRHQHSHGLIKSVKQFLSRTLSFLSIVYFNGGEYVFTGCTVEDRMKSMAL